MHMQQTAVTAVEIGHCCGCSLQHFLHVLGIYFLVLIVVSYCLMLQDNVIYTKLYSSTCGKGARPQQRAPCVGTVYSLRVRVRDMPVAPMAYQVILEPGKIGQFRALESPRVHTRKNS